MNGVLATFDRNAGTWTFEADYGVREVPIYIGAIGDTPIMLGAHLGFTATQDGVTLLDYAFPPEGQRLISSDQQYVCFAAIDIPSDSDVLITVFFDENGVRSEGEYVLTPKTTPYPEDGGEYVWQYDVWAPVE